VETLQHRRFAEFCDACKRYGYIGLCYGPPGVGKTLSARHYANWDTVQAYCNLQNQTKALAKEVSRGTTAFYTSPVVSSPGHLERDISKSRSVLHNVAIERARRYEHARMARLLRRVDDYATPKRTRMVIAVPKLTQRRMPIWTNGIGRCEFKALCRIRLPYL
jgi:Holliday junction resolvasome RuvABC ATP-dependent DNA helicase subunit